MASEWSDELVLSFIDEFKKFRCLWDPKDTDRKSKNKKNDAYRELSVQFKKPSEEIKKKIMNLIQSYRGYRRKIKTTKVSGAGRKDYVFKPSWFAFDSINTFMEDAYTPYGTIETMGDISESNDEYNVSDDINNESYIENTEDNVNITKGNNDEGQKNLECSSETNIERNTFSAPIAPRKKKKIEKDKNEIRVSQVYEYFMQKQKESQKKMEKDEYDIYGALVATKLRKMDEITRQCVMNEKDNLMFRAIIKSNSHKHLQPHSSQNTTLNYYVQQPYSLPSQFQTFNYTQQPFPSPSQFSTFSHTSQPSPSNSSTPSHSSQVSPPLNN